MVNEISATPGGAEQSEQTVKTEELDWGREIERDKEFTNEAIAVANQTVGKAEQRAKEVEVNVTKEAQTAQEKLDKIEAEIFERERPAQEEIERIERQIIIPEGLEFVSDTESGGQIKNEVGPRYPKTRFFEGGLTHEIETVKPEAEIVPNLTHPELFDLPIAGWPETREQLVFRGGYLLDALVKVVTHEETPEKKLFGTKAAGRAGFLEPFAFKTREGNSTFTNLYFKGIGITSTRAALQPVVEEGTQRELLEKWQEKLPIFEPVEKEVLGMSIFNDAKQDGEKSLKMHRWGIRTRLPVVCFKLHAVPQDGSTTKMEDLAGKGWPVKLDEEHWPVVSVWARRNPFTFADVTWALNEAVSKGSGEKVARETTDQLFCYLQFEEDSEGRKIAADYWNIRSKEPKTTDEGVSQNMQLSQVENRWILWLAEMYGTEMKKLRGNGILHGMLSGQNCSVGIEFSDNSNAEFWEVNESNFQSFISSHNNEVKRIIEAITTLKFALENAQGKVFDEAESEEKIREAFYESYLTKG